MARYAHADARYIDARCKLHVCREHGSFPAWHPNVTRFLEAHIQLRLQREFAIGRKTMVTRPMLDKWVRHLHTEGWAEQLQHAHNEFKTLEYMLMSGEYDSLVIQDRAGGTLLGAAPGYAPEFPDFGDELTYGGRFISSRSIKTMVGQECAGRIRRITNIFP